MKSLWRAPALGLVLLAAGCSATPQRQPQSRRYPKNGVRAAARSHLKTAQRHDYPSRSWRRSFARRTGVERSNARVKDPATIDIGKGWCRLMGLVGPTLLLAAAFAICNLAIADAFEARRADDERRKRVGLAPRTRHRRRTTLSDLLGASP